MAKLKVTGSYIMDTARKMFYDDFDFEKANGISFRYSDIEIP